MIYQQKRPAMTLIELLVVMAISTIVTGVISAIFVNSWKAHISQEVYSELQQKSRISIDEITNTLKVASGVMVSYANSGTTYTTSANTLVIKTPSLDNNNQVLSANDYFIFRVNPTDTTKLQRLIFADSSSVRASLPQATNINDRMGTTTFTYYDTSGQINLATGDVTTTISVDVTVSSQKTSQGRLITRSLDNRVYLRNKL